MQVAEAGLARTKVSAAQKSIAGVSRGSTVNFRPSFRWQRAYIYNNFYFSRLAQIIIHFLNWHLDANAMLKWHAVRIHQLHLKIRTLCKPASSDAGSGLLGFRTGFNAPMRVRSKSKWAFQHRDAGSHWPGKHRAETLLVIRLAWSLLERISYERHGGSGTVPINRPTERGHVLSDANWGCKGHPV